MTAAAKERAVALTPADALTELQEYRQTLFTSAGCNCWECCQAAALDQAIEALREVCICAAITYDGAILRGQNHSQCFQALDALVAARVPGTKANGMRIVQGFMTSRGRFVERAEGLRLQLAAGIASKAPNGYCGDILYSEDLY